MNKVFVEENGVYQIDLSAADNAVGDLKDKYKNIDNRKLYDDVVKKFYGSSYYMLACEKKKPVISGSIYAGNLQPNSL